MSDSASADSPTADSGGYRVNPAPYALVRATVLAYPAQDPAAATFRAALDDLVRVHRALLDTADPLCDALYASRCDHPRDFHRDVVLPLRRAVHNGRDPRPAVLERLGDLPTRVPALAYWLGRRDRHRALVAALETAAEPALTAERAALADLCRQPALGRAVALTSADLLRAVERASTGRDDRRARKEEPTVLRHALRASTKTSPLSWFTAVGWGPLPQRPHGPRVASWGEHSLLDGPLRAVVTVNRTLTGALTAALLDAPHRRAALPHRVTSTARVADGRAAYARSRAVFAGGRYLVSEEDEAEVAFSGPLRLVTERAREPLSLDALTDALAEALPGADAGRAAAAFLDRLGEAGLLVPADPVPPQDGDPLARLAAWLRTFGPPAGEDGSPGGDGGAPGSGDGAPGGEEGAPGGEDGPPGREDGATGSGDGALADRLDHAARLTAAFGPAPAAERVSLLSTLSRHWGELLADAGRPTPAGSAPLNVLSEDVVAPRPLVLDGMLDEADHEALAEVTALAELFDLGHLVRRIVRDRFVERYGGGGCCPHPWEFGADVATAWEEAGRIATLRAADAAGLPTGVTELAALRAAVADAVRASLAGDEPPDGRAVEPPGGQPDGRADGWSDGRSTGADAPSEGRSDGRADAPSDGRSVEPPRGPSADTDVVLPPDCVKGLGERLPRWAVERPASYAHFLQRDPASGLLCVNHVYGGWGRFTSRFLDALEPGAARAVARQVRRGLGPDARAAQIRPVGGFNANLHPLLVPDEIGADRRWTSLREADVELYHDEAADQVRFRTRATGEPLDVLYPGFLAPIMLPRRIGAHLCDQPHGVVDFRSLVPRYSVTAPGGQVVRTPRLRHRHMVLLRRRWLLPQPVVGALTAELTAAHGVPAEVVARWRALLTLPEQIFLHPAATAVSGRATEDFLAALRRPKPQFVDLGNALHLRCLGRWLARHPDGAVLEEALPAPGGSVAPTRAVELVVETYRAGRP
ncbi:lantibiotic dehydratase family protein [Streptomyces sp. LX-29]|uniref:lantibiotic dehydratase n=1 Tax=Streptomyces sp. LX-29 TaxID=2900152 RepID=UPI00240DB11D|nr:lantibiotic dehydratase [Streptomyces sp. LX-29]WFB05867.1 lantibiotic dehydratase family protein [Streptomyces sp. LX-29]